MSETEQKELVKHKVAAGLTLLQAQEVVAAQVAEDAKAEEKAAEEGKKAEKKGDKK